MPSSENLVEILLVEDNKGDIELTREAFYDSKLHNKLHILTDGEAALDYLFKRNGYEAASSPDIVLLDINLPKISGKEVLEIVKNDPGLKHIPFVILTGSDADKDILASYRLHANCYVCKPTTLNAFMGVIKLIEDFWLSIVKLPPLKPAR